MRQDKDKSSLVSLDPAMKEAINKAIYEDAKKHVQQLNQSIEYTEKLLDPEGLDNDLKRSCCKKDKKKN